MSQRKVHSNHSIAFSWEDKPGVPKTLNHDDSNTIESIEATSQKSSSSILTPPTTTWNHLDDSSNRTPTIQGINIPLPPCQSQPTCRSTPWKGFRRQEDPFLVAYKECTKTRKIDKKKGVGFNSSVRKSKFAFSCRDSVDTRDDNLLKPSLPPRIPHASSPSFTNRG